MILATVSGSTTNSGPLKEIAQNKMADSSFASYSFFLDKPRLPIKSFHSYLFLIVLSPSPPKKNKKRRFTYLQHFIHVSDQCLGEKDQNE